VTEPIDTTNWTTYTSDQSGFKVGHPPEWIGIPPAGAGGMPMSMTR
jgi:hypothetical protein